MGVLAVDSYMKQMGVSLWPLCGEEPMGDARWKYLRHLRIAEAAAPRRRRKRQSQPAKPRNKWRKPAVTYGWTHTGAFRCGVLLTVVLGKVRSGLMGANTGFMVDGERLGPSAFVIAVRRAVKSGKRGRDENLVLRGKAG